jgi:hypothetical protein
MSNQSVNAMIASLWWPQKEPSSSLLFTVDISAPLTAISDSAVQVDLAWTPWGPNEVQPSQLALDDTPSGTQNAMISVRLDGGIPARIHTFYFKIRTVAGNTFTWKIQLEIDPAHGTMPWIPPDNIDLSPALVWNILPDLSQDIESVSNVIGTLGFFQVAVIPAMMYFVEQNASVWAFRGMLNGIFVPEPIPPPTVPSLDFRDNRNAGLWAFRGQLSGPFTPEGQPIPPDVVIPSLNFTVSENFGLWMTKGRVLAKSTPPPVESGPLLDFTNPANASLMAFRGRLNGSFQP